MRLEIGLVISQVIAFLLMLWVLKKFAWKPILQIMEERKKNISTEFEQIEEQKKANEKLIDLYNQKLEKIEDEAKLKVQEAIQESQKISEKIQEEARVQAKAILNKAKEDSKEEISKAKHELKTDLINMVTATTQKLLQNLDEEKHKKLIHDFVEEIL